MLVVAGIHSQAYVTNVKTVRLPFAPETALIFVKNAFGVVDHNRHRNLIVETVITVNTGSLNSQPMYRRLETSAKVFAEV